MLKKIEALRKRPKHVRDQYAFWIALSCTIFVAIGWALTIPNRFSTEVSLSEDTSEHLSTFSRLWGRMKTDLSASIANVSEQATSTPKEDPKPKPQNDETSIFFATSTKKSTSSPQAIRIATSTNATSTTE